jgi:hypothetical protein
MAKGREEEDVRVVAVIGGDSALDETAHPLVVMPAGALLKRVFLEYSLCITLHSCNSRNENVQFPGNNEVGGKKHRAHDGI